MLSIKFINFRVAYWFSLPFAYKRKRECEVSPPVGEVARSAREVDRQNRALTTLRAGAQLNDSKALKGCGSGRQTKFV